MTSNGVAKCEEKISAALSALPRIAVVGGDNEDGEQMAGFVGDRVINVVLDVRGEGGGVDGGQGAAHP